MKVVPLLKEESWTWTVTEVPKNFSFWTSKESLHFILWLLYWQTFQFSYYHIYLRLPSADLLGVQNVRLLSGPGASDFVLLWSIHVSPGQGRLLGCATSAVIWGSTFRRKPPSRGLMHCNYCYEILTNFIFDCFVSEVWWDNGACTGGWEPYHKLCCLPLLAITAHSPAPLQ